MSDQGFVKLDREIVDHWVFKSDPECRIWIHLIFLAKFSNSDKPVKIGNQERVLDRGEFITSIQTIASTLGLKYNQVRRVLDLFKKNDMIQKSVGRGKNIPYVAKIVNYEKWQGEYIYKHNHSTIKSQSRYNHNTFKMQHTNNGNNANNGYNGNPTWNYKCDKCDVVVEQDTPISDLYIECQKCEQPAIRYKANDD